MWLATLYMWWWWVLKLCESLLFSNLFHIFIFVLFEDKQKGKFVGVIYHEFYPLLAMVYECFRVYYMGFEYVSDTFWRPLVILGLLELFEYRTTHTYHVFKYEWRPSHGAIEPIFGHKIEFLVSFPMTPVEVNPMVRSEARSVLLKSGQSVSREKTIE